MRREWSTSEVARELGISPSLVRTWVAYMSWEVRRNVEGHRVFSDEDVAQLRGLREWLDRGNTLREFRKERQGEGPFDPRLELRNGLRRLRELHSQEEALLARQRALIDQWAEGREAFLARLEGLTARAEGAADAGGPLAGPPPQPDGAAIASQGETVQGVLKQLLTALLERQGKLQLLGRREAEGRAYLDYVGPGGRLQSVEDLCSSEADRRMLDTVLNLITTTAPARS
ncbi:MAG: MerR family transcriptional regulator [Candidatus Sericytochromatia bacterium]|nr:MerR family transcriptional regulator [Candidatus Sericytochromatia bacterium]